ncbi:hypothetical protein EPD60_15875 [Flaviaesturariibacter flavus]|uniref:SprB repeat-containing protein n=1 Tax=Flaviaesturariibacter flavus TaxID=2502780 RepID=A0A4R1B1Y1_9BACT|nr:SprB repeat-containing protein [Flaviaesturariibacter flavus]TCJ12034.1 hypothetical protein EPD60_15875 [Flaviaesturariibacter flavus]
MLSSLVKRAGIAIPVLLLLFYACSKPSGNDNTAPVTPPANPCVGVTVTVTGTVTNATTGQSNGAISVTATGGSGFTFSKDGTNFGASGSFANLAAGTYTITAKNSSGCTGSAQFTVGATNPCTGVTINVTATPIGATTGQSNGSIGVTATGGASPYTFSKDGGTTFQASGSFTGLAAGSYTIIVRDANGCTGSATATVASVNPCAGVTITVTARADNAMPGQSNGAVNATATGGSGPYTFSLNNGAFQSSGTFANLAAGNYTVVAKDANGCTGTATATVGTINPCAGVTVGFTPTVQTATPCTLPFNGSITINATGGSAPYTYSFNGGSSFQGGNAMTGLDAGPYPVIVRDANGCSSANTNVNVGVTPMGTLFSQVKSILQANCAVSGCHNISTQQNGLNFSDICTIVQQADRIKARAVDLANTPSQMPQPPRAALTASERATITNWVNAGGGYSN